MTATPPQRPLLHVLDVDGTLTRHDSLVLLLRFLKPAFFERFFFWCSLWPTACLALATGRPHRLKQALLSRLWKGRSRTEIAAVCQQFFTQKLEADLRPRALACLHALRQQDPTIQLVLLSASCRPWLQPLAAYLQAHLICTELQYDAADRFTGRFATPNCKGPEKVRRLLAVYPASRYRFACYGNAQSDKALQSISEQFFYRYF